MLDNEAERLRNEVVAELQSQGVDSFKGSVGTATVSTRFSVKMPKDPEIKQELKEYMLKQNAFEGMWTINHQSLNSWYKQEIEAAKMNSTMVDVPGLEPVADKWLSFRKSAN